MPITVQYGTLPFDPARHIVHVPVASFVVLDCDHCLRGLEALRGSGRPVEGLVGDRHRAEHPGERRDRRGFRLAAVHRLRHDVRPGRRDPALSSDEPVIAGVYAAKKLGNGRINCHFEEGIDEGQDGAVGRPALSDPGRRGRLPPDQGLGPPAYREAARAAVVQDGGAARLPVLPADGRYRRRRPVYFGEDYAFIRRCRQAGLVPKVDTSFRLWHVGDYAYGIEEAAGEYLPRSRNLLYKIDEGDGPKAVPAPLWSDDGEAKATHAAAAVDAVRPAARRHAPAPRLAGRRLGRNPDGSDAIASCAPVQGRKYAVIRLADRS